MSNYKLTYKSYGEHSILIEWPPLIDENILSDVLRYKKILQNKRVKENIYIKSAYSSILISYDITIENVYDEISQLKLLYLNKESIIESAFRLWRIPVCYDDDFGIDLEELTAAKDLPKEKIIDLHSAQIYTVFFIGFLPGFLYLGGLNSKLNFPRKETPRLQIKKGAVAIGGNQTGVYPNVSPGGWNIIGNSPINFFDVNKLEPCFARAGDKIQFYSVSKEVYYNISTLVDAGVYQIESEVLSG